MKRTLALATALAFAVAACGDDGPTGPGGGSKSMSATIDGADVTFPSTGVTAVYTNNVLQIGGTTVTNPVRQVNISLNGITATGTYNLNPAALPNNLATVTIVSGGSASVWTTALSPATGSITLTTLSGDRVAGTFQFTGQAGPGTPATGQKSVTSGSFDIEL